MSNKMEVNSSSSSSSSSSSDSEITLPSIKFTAPKIYQRRIDENYFSDEEFKIRFRFSKKTVRYIVELVKNELKRMDNRGLPLTVMQKVLITLRYYATGCFQRDCNDLFGVSQSTVHRAVHECSRSFAGLSKYFIKMPPTVADRNKNMEQFNKIGKIPHCVGCIDSCHIPIKSPGGPNADIFRNRKGFFSINVQGVCDADCKFTDLVARWHGSVHDQIIFKFSTIKNRFDENEFGNCYLIGDGGYGCSKYLITPYTNPDTPQKIALNNALSATRSRIERTFGLWQNRFAILRNASQIELQNMLTIIVATAVLHNISILQNDGFEYKTDNSDDNLIVPEIPPNKNDFKIDTTIRDILAQSL